MTDFTAGPEAPLKILHILRAPVGGLFRHVLDLAREQVRRGHAVGLIADSIAGGPAAEKALADLAPQLALGLRRLPMHRSPHLSDLVALSKISRCCRASSPDILHGHGAKGGLYGRLVSLGARAPAAVRVYTPHGGSLNYEPGTLAHSLYMKAERFMGSRTDLLLFESGHIANRFITLVGTPRHLFRVVRNGISEAEFVPVRAAPDAADFLYVGELRALKGIDTLLDALALLGERLGRRPRLVLVGAGAEQGALQARAARLGLTEQVCFPGPLPARQAFARGRILVVPSRAESLPYIVLEAAGARVPMIATSVGGIPEIFGPFQGRLIQPNAVEVLATRMGEMLAADDALLQARAEDLAGFVQARFSIGGMVDDILTSYRDALAKRGAASRATQARPERTQPGNGWRREA